MYLYKIKPTTPSPNLFRGISTLLSLQRITFNRKSQQALPPPPLQHDIDQFDWTTSTEWGDQNPTQPNQKATRNGTWKLKREEINDTIAQVRSMQGPEESACHLFGSGIIGAMVCWGERWHSFLGAMIRVAKVNLGSCWELFHSQVLLPSPWSGLKIFYQGCAGDCVPTDIALMHHWQKMGSQEWVSLTASLVCICFLQMPLVVSLAQAKTSGWKRIGRVVLLKVCERTPPALL